MTAPELVDRLRAALVAAGYTYDGVAGALGPEAHAALSRNETVPGLRRTAGGSPLETLTRLFLLQHPVGLDRAEAVGVEPRISDETLGAALIEGGGAVEPYRLVLALTRAAEGLGVAVRHGRATW